MRIEEGEIVELDNGKEYVVYSVIPENEKNYVYLMSNFKPVEMMFAKEVTGTSDDDISLEIIHDQEEKQKVLELFKNQNYMN